ncbi:type IV secretory system conjugative DNA transfer family protein [Streptomyces sp. NPDC059970]|uniref:type IV secretory system conjugative DNA transfer family protein n=1 Tax=Streptomyces sp. NPDC059970 TaxID=3347019 RepID=UPI0036AF4373
MATDVLLGHDDCEDLVRLLHSHRTSHVAIVGKSGFGKTTLIEHLALADMHDGTAAVIIDAHGDLTRRLIALAPTVAHDKIVLVEPNTERPFGLNLYECVDPNDPAEVERTVGHVRNVFDKLMGHEVSGGYRALIDPGLRNTARALVANGLTMAELPLLYTDAAFRAAVIRALPTATDYWLEYERSDPRRRQEKREPILNKVARFLDDGLIAPMVSQAKTTIPIRQAMDHGGTLVLNLAGQNSETVSFLGMVLLSTLSNELHRRERIPENQRRRVHLYLDEYGRFATPTTHWLLREGRKYGLGMTIAQQDLAQTPKLEALDVETLITFQVSGADARLISGNLDRTPRRTRRVLRPRTEAQYLESEDEVWDSASAKSRCEALRRHQRLTEQGAKTADLLLSFFDSHLNRRLHMTPNHVDRGWTYEGSFPIDQIRAGKPIPTGGDTPLSWHIPFNPAGCYFEHIVETFEEYGCCTRGRYPSSLGWEVPFPEAYVLRSDASSWSWFSFLVYGTDRENVLVAPYLAELSQLLSELYSSRGFSFKPRNRTWLDREAPRPFTGTGERINAQTTFWPTRGDWRIQLFPPAVEWFAEKIRSLQEQVSAYESLTSQIDRELAAHRTLEQRQIPMGELHVLNSDGEKLYEYVEEPDQSHADRREEIITTLVTLKRHLSYCKITDSAGHPREHLVTMLPPAGQAEASLNRSDSGHNIFSVRTRSRMAYGTSREEVARVAAQRVQDLSPTANVTSSTADKKDRHSTRREDTTRNTQQQQKSKPPSIGRRSPKKNQ